MAQKYSDTLQIQQNIKKTFHYGATTKEYTVSIKDIQSVDVSVGFDLAEMLIAIINGEEISPKTFVMPATLVIRKSTAQLLRDSTE